MGGRFRARLISYKGLGRRDQLDQTEIVRRVRTQSGGASGQVRS